MEDGFSYTREIGIIPNITVADISDDVADKLVKVMGAVAVSRYSNKNYCYDSVKKLTDRGLKQCNIHQLAAFETMDQIKETFNDYKTDERLKGLNAIVLLSLKKKGRGEKYTSLSQEQFKEIVDLAFELNIPIGMDSCSCHKLLNSIKDREDYKQIEMMSEPCESSIMSAYCNTLGFFFPCSFTEGTDGWEEGIDIVHCEDFIKDVWHSTRVEEFRKTLLEHKRSCPIYTV